MAPNIIQATLYLMVSWPAAAAGAAPAQAWFDTVVALPPLAIAASTNMTTLFLSCPGRVIRSASCSSSLQTSPRAGACSSAGSSPPSSAPLTCWASRGCPAACWGAVPVLLCCLLHHWQQLRRPRHRGCCPMLPSLSSQATSCLQHPCRLCRIQAIGISIWASSQVGCRQGLHMFGRVVTVQRTAISNGPMHAQQLSADLQGLPCLHSHPRVGHPPTHPYTHAPPCPAVLYRPR